jgi:polyisoprenoid-binding protein YceI
MKIYHPWFHNRLAYPILSLGVALILLAGCKPAREAANEPETTAPDSSAGAVAPPAAPAAGAIRYEAQPGSEVRIDGTSTIHDWTVKSQVVGGFMEVDPGFPESALKTGANMPRPRVEVSIPVRTLKSYAKTMDEVMQKHMGMTNHPKIEYRLIELRPTGATNGAARFDAVGALTVSGKTRTNTMPVTIERIDKARLKVTGATPLKMTDFGIEPPAPSIAGFPLIKTGDEVRISFDWLAAQKIETAK